MSHLLCVGFARLGLLLDESRERVALVKRGGGCRAQRVQLVRIVLRPLAEIGDGNGLVG